jgi:hypothetical protein
METLFSMSYQILIWYSKEFFLFFKENLTKKLRKYKKIMSATKMDLVIQNSQYSHIYLKVALLEFKQK